MRGPARVSNRQLPPTALLHGDRTPAPPKRRIQAERGSRTRHTQSSGAAPETVAVAVPADVTSWKRRRHRSTPYSTAAAIAYG